MLGVLLESLQEVIQTVTGTDHTYAGADKITITLDNTAPTVTLSDTDDDNLLATSDTGDYYCII